MTASGLDLYADWQGWDLVSENRHQFMGRASRRDTHEEDGTLTGFEFGRRKTATLAARIYDKTLQVHEKGLDWWPAVWGPAFDPANRIWRVEFEFGREGLRSSESIQRWRR